jgi:hypothetical protein
MEDNDRVHLVRVTTDSRERRVYAVATHRKEALDKVLKLIPEGWSANLLSEQLAAKDAAKLNLRPGDVRDITQ